MYIVVKWLYRKIDINMTERYYVVLILRSENLLEKNK